MSRRSDIDADAVLAAVSHQADRYEAALAVDDVEVLTELFWDDRRVVRLGVTESLRGADEIRRFREGRSPGSAARTNLDRWITTFGDTAAIVVQHFERAGRRGRQSQTWVRFGDHWRIVEAHVSFLPTVPES